MHFQKMRQQSRSFASYWSAPLPDFDYCAALFFIAVIRD
jgi:hypothetical protein